MSQFDLNLFTEKKTGPVECLGQTFPSDEARRAHYLELLREKLRDPEFRKIEGFPIGEDEDILNLSDPPYYTACPNPWIGDFIAHYGKSFDPAEKYHRHPITGDLEESRNNKFVNAHSYVTKTPHQSIMRLILHYTDPGDVVLDGFSGTGMAGVAAQMCESADPALKNNLNKLDPSIRFGPRHIILSDLSVVGGFIAYNLNNPVPDDFDTATEKLETVLTDELSWMYKTRHTDGTEGDIIALLWSDVFRCPECGDDIDYWDSAVDLKESKIRDKITCPACGTEMAKAKLEKSWSNIYDPSLEHVVQLQRMRPKIVIYEQNGKRFEKKLDEHDLSLIRDIEEIDIGLWYPTAELPKGFNTEQPKRSHGLHFIHQYFTRRNLYSLAVAWDRAKDKRSKFLLTSLMYKTSVLCSPLMSNYFASRKGVSRGGWIGKERSGTLYCPSIHSEVVLPAQIRSRKKSVSITAYSQNSATIITSQSSRMLLIPSNSVDYIFTDPPFGANRMYSEINFLWEAWLKVITNNDDEAIENPATKKTLLDYKRILVAVFGEYYRVLKPGRWISVQFSNTKAVVWNTLQATLAESGFIVASVSTLHKQQGSIEAYTSTTAVKQDLVISAYKPNGGLEKRFAKHGDSIEGVWDFLQTHLKNLPVVKPRGGQLERIAERDPRILYDRMVAFYIGHNTPVPLSSGEFQAAMHEKYPERDGMVFLAEQVAEYDAQAAKMEHVGQLSIFVEDEKSAINWIRQYLKDKPDTFQGIHPEFMQQLSASWKKFETRPELSLLLDQNFLKYNGEDTVPSQIHSYLSTNYPNLRGKEKDDPALKAKAKDRWYVPDPKKALDVEAVRNKRLAAEFWALCSEFGVKMSKQDGGQHTQNPEPKTQNSKPKKLKEVRSEAIRYGFLECHRSQDAATILAIARILPENVIEEDEQLQMIVDMAEMRAE